VLDPAPTAGGARGPVAQAPQELPAGTHIQRGQSELVENASVALIAAHNCLGKQRKISKISRILNI